MINNKVTMKYLRNTLYNELKKEIGNRNVVLLDLPNYFNPGDQLIWEGTAQILKSLGKNVKYSSSVHFFNSKTISSEDCILLQGGGNFGDLYNLHQSFREYIVKMFPNNKIIILPVTVHFTNEKRLQKSIDIFKKSKNLVICARDNNSFKELKKKFLNCKILLLPDAAFGIKDLGFKKSKLKKTNKILFLSRTDKELGNNLSGDSLRFIDNLHTFDWPTMRVSTKVGLFIDWTVRYVNKFILKFIKKLGFRWNKNYDVFGVIKTDSKKTQIQKAVSLLSQYDLIITSRLHGHILACLLGIPNILIDNSYGKNKSFFKTWMLKNSFNAYYADSAAEVRKVIKNHFPNVKLIKQTKSL